MIYKCETKDTYLSYPSTMLDIISDNKGEKNTYFCMMVLFEKAKLVIQGVTSLFCDVLIVL